MSNILFVCFFKSPQFYGSNIEWTEQSIQLHYIFPILQLQSPYGSGEQLQRDEKFIIVSVYLACQTAVQQIHPRTRLCFSPPTTHRRRARLSAMFVPWSKTEIVAA